MTYKVAALYQFVPLPDFRELKAPLERFCADLGIKGSLLLAQRGHQRHARRTSRGDRPLRGRVPFGAALRGAARQSGAQILVRRRDAVPAPEDPAQEGNRHPGRSCDRSDPAGRDLCGGRGLERACSKRPAWCSSTRAISSRSRWARSRAPSIPDIPTVQRFSRLRRARARSADGTRRWRCSAPAASAAKRPAPSCCRKGSRRSITSRAAS